MNLIDRFRYIMKLNGLTASAFADTIGVQRSSVSHILSGRNKPSLEFIQKVIAKYPKVDATWLISGSTKLEVDRLPVEAQSEKVNTNNAEVHLKQESTVAPKMKDECEKESSGDSKKEIDKILVFYSDGTFKEFKQSTN